MEDVLNAWDFWEKRGIIKKHALSEALGDYDVEFLSLRQLYIDNNFTQNAAEQPKKASLDDLIDSTKNPELNDMFYQIDQLMRRQLQPKERQEVLTWIYDFHHSPSLILKAFLFAVEVKGVKNINYTKSILTHWYDQGVISPEDADHYMEIDSKSYAVYRAIYKTLGFTNRTVSAGDKELIDKWLQTYGLSLDFIIEVLKERSTRTSNVNMKYMDAAMTDLYNREIRSISAFEEDLKKQQQVLADKKAQRTSDDKSTADKSGGVSKAANKNKFHQFEQSKTDYTDKDLEKLLRNRR
jgi:DnaD/phage-associated family protein